MVVPKITRDDDFINVLHDCTLVVNYTLKEFRPYVAICFNKDLVGITNREHLSFQVNENSKFHTYALEITNPSLIEYLKGYLETVQK
jgi:hypothetical protein